MPKSASEPYLFQWQKLTLFLATREISTICILCILYSSNVIDITIKTSVEGNCTMRDSKHYPTLLNLFPLLTKTTSNFSHSCTSTYLRSWWIRFQWIKYLMTVYKGMKFQFVLTEHFMRGRRDFERLQWAITKQSLILLLGEYKSHTPCSYKYKFHEFII